MKMKTKKDEQIDVVQNLMTCCSLMIECVDAIEDSRHWINVLKNRANSLRKECERITNSIYLKYMADNAKIDQYHHETINVFDLVLKQMVKMSRPELAKAYTIMNSVEADNFIIADSEDFHQKKVVADAVKNYALLIASLPSDYPSSSLAAHKELQAAAQNQIHNESAIN